MFLVSDICELKQYFDDDHAVSVVRSIAQFEQSSVMLFNNEHPKNRTLTPEYIQNTDENLHGLCWLSEAEVGDMDNKWNQLVGYQRCGYVRESSFHYGSACFPRNLYLGVWADLDGLC